MEKLTSPVSDQEMVRTQKAASNVRKGDIVVVRECPTQVVVTDITTPFGRSAMFVLTVTHLATGEVRSINRVATDMNVVMVPKKEA